MLYLSQEISPLPQLRLLRIVYSQRFIEDILKIILSYRNFFFPYYAWPGLSLLSFFFYFIFFNHYRIWNSCEVKSLMYWVCIGFYMANDKYS